MFILWIVLGYFIGMTSTLAQVIIMENKHQTLIENILGKKDYVGGYHRNGIYMPKVSKKHIERNLKR